MKIKQYLGTDMRDALRQIRAELGPDAVILSTRPLGNGVEVSAAVDVQALRGAVLAEYATSPAVAPSAIPTLAATASADASRAPPFPAAPLADAPAIGEIPTASIIPSRADWSGVHEQQAMSHELRTLRRLLERQMAALAWNDYTRREPLRTRVLTELTDLGLARDVALALLAQLPGPLTSESIQQAYPQLVARNIVTCASPLAEGGAVALIGACGSGRSSVLAKLALRWLLEHGAESLAIASIDDEHIGAAAQTQALGRVLGVPCYCFADVGGLRSQAGRLRGYQCLLIDTPALSTQVATPEFSAELSGALPGLRSMLILAASTQAGVLEESVRRAGSFAPVACTLTRVDEALRLGAALSVLIRTRLPVAFVSDSPRIPEGLHTARADELVGRAMELARSAPSQPDEELLAQRFGGEINAAA